jgi:hypothetical protein
VPVDFQHTVILQLSVVDGVLFPLVKKKVQDALCLDFH